MRIAVLTREGELLSLAERIKWEGHSSLLTIRDPRFGPRGRGLVETRVVGRGNGLLLAELRKFAPEICVVSTKCAADVDFVERMGWRVWGTSHLSPDALSIAFYDGLGLKAKRRGFFWNGTEASGRFALRRVGRFLAGDLGVKMVVGVTACNAPRWDQEEESLGLLRKGSFRGPAFFGQRISLGLPIGELAPLLEMLSPDTTLTQVIEGKPVSLKMGVAVAVQVSVPPWPFPFEKRKAQLFQLEEGAEPHFWRVDCCADQVCGVTGEVGWATAFGDTIQEARKRCYRTLSRLQLEEVQFRVGMFRSSLPC